MFDRNFTLAVSTAWKQAPKTKTAADLALYNLARGLPITRGFTPITKPIKLANGMKPLAGLEPFENAHRMFMWASGMNRGQEHFKIDNAKAFLARQFPWIPSECLEALTNHLVGMTKINLRGV